MIGPDIEQIKAVSLGGSLSKIAPPWLGPADQKEYYAEIQGKLTLLVFDPELSKSRFKTFNKDDLSTMPATCT